MLSLGAFALASPMLLAGLLALPVIWLLLRVTPPAPRQVIFPAIRFLFGLRPREETPAHTPWWLLLLRLVLAAALIIGLAHPLMNPSVGLGGKGPVLIVVDDGWSSARNWQLIQQTAIRLTEQAEREGRPVMLQTTAAQPGTEHPMAPILRRPAEIRAMLQALQPKPWSVDRAGALAALDAAQLSGPIEVVYLADGLADPALTLYAEALQRLGGLRIETGSKDDLPLTLSPPERSPGDLTLVVHRAASGPAQEIGIRATAEDGRLLARIPAQFEADATRAEAVLSLPVELRNVLTRIDIEAQNHAAATVLFDDLWQRRPVGVVTGNSRDATLSLLDDQFYLERALGPFAELRRGPVADLLKTPPALILMADDVTLSADERNALVGFVDRGGALVRFAGDKLVGEGDELLPVRLRGGRTLGSAMQWSDPAHLAPFDAASPFSGLTVPEDVTVSKQVLAEPSIDLADHIWAKLSDGTPLVTAAKRGSGTLVLFHVPASADWSNLPLSGLFVEMLRRTVLLGRGSSDGKGGPPLAPLQTLDGFAHLGAPSASAAPSPADGKVDPHHPPGFYGNDTMRRALNLSAQLGDLKPLETVPSGVAVRLLGSAGEVDLRPWFLGAALALLLLDIVIGLGLRGLLPGVRTATRTAVIAGFLLLTGIAPALAAPPPSGDPTVDFALKATLETRLAYVITGVRELDDLSKAGLQGLTNILNRRTAIDAADPIAVDLERDELAFFPLLYWPVSEQQAPLSREAVAKVNFFLRNGGTILFDTRGENDVTGSARTNPLTALVRGIEIPPLMPVPADHVLNKTFYLLHDFPGRYAGAPLWIEARDNPNDEVSSVLVGGNDYAGAWAVDAAGRTVTAPVPGGDNQREMAYRFGVNLVMYALTGNYKTDQVHVPAILERLGQ